jgi:hypothetical protein
VTNFGGGVHDCRLLLLLLLLLCIGIVFLVLFVLPRDICVLPIGFGQGIRRLTYVFEMMNEVSADMKDE